MWRTLRPLCKTQPKRNQQVMAACHSDASGEEWISSSEYFGESKSFAKANSLMEFSATSDRVRGVAVKLIRQQGGNLRTSMIRKDQF